MTLHVTVTDEQGNPVSNETVTYSIVKKYLGIIPIGNNKIGVIDSKTNSNGTTSYMFKFTADDIGFKNPIPYNWVIEASISEDTDVVSFSYKDIQCETEGSSAWIVRGITLVKSN